MTIPDKLSPLGYTPAYFGQVDALTEWLTERLNRLSPVVYTQEERDVGVDALPKHIRGLAKQASDIWLNERQYELSYSQMCTAMFRAIDQLARET